MEKMTATIKYLQIASASILEAATRLDRQDSYHQEHAQEILRLAELEIARCRRQIDRAIEKRHTALCKK